MKKGPLRINLNRQPLKPVNPHLPLILSSKTLFKALTAEENFLHTFC